jgi:hypothetical protein
VAAKGKEPADCAPRAYCVDSGSPLVSRTLACEPGQVSCCGSQSVIVNHGAFEPTKKCPSGALLGA